jgi:hypothetical protein
MIHTRIAGIPCTIQVGRVFVQEPMGPSADSDWDCYGYSEIEFTVCDRRGRPAPWLERKMTYDEKSDIETLILENVE